MMRKNAFNATMEEYSNEGLFDFLKGKPKVIDTKDANKHTLIDLDPTKITIPEGLSVTIKTTYADKLFKNGVLNGGVIKEMQSVISNADSFYGKVKSIIDNYERSHATFGRLFDKIEAGTIKDGSTIINELKKITKPKTTCYEAAKAVKLGSLGSFVYTLVDGNSFIDGVKEGNESESTIKLSTFDVAALKRIAKESFQLSEEVGDNDNDLYEMESYKLSSPVIKPFLETIKGDKAAMDILTTFTEPNSSRAFLGVYDAIYRVLDDIFLTSIALLHIVHKASGSK